MWPQKCFESTSLHCKRRPLQLTHDTNGVQRKHRRIAAGLAAAWYCEGATGCIQSAAEHKPKGLAGVGHASKLGHQLQGISERTLLAGRDGQVIGEGLIASQLAQALQPQLKCALQATACLATILEHLARWLCFWQTLHSHTL